MNFHMVGEVTNCLELMHKSDVRHGPWIITRRQFESELEPEMLTCTKAETGLRSGKWFWPPHAKSWLTGKDSDAGRDWGQEEKGTTEHEKAGWHHRLNGCEFEWTPGDSDGQGGLVCCDSWGRRESDMTERLNWTELDWNMPGLPVLHCRVEFAHTHVHWVSDAKDR